MSQILIKSTHPGCEAGLGEAFEAGACATFCGIAAAVFFDREKS